MNKGFSLIELLISLVIISVIIAALTPIMTKKMSKSNMVVKVAAAKKGLQIYTNPGTYAFDVPEGVDKIYISGAAGGGGGAGAKSIPKTQTFNSSTTYTVPIGVNSITLKLYGGGGGGGGGYGNTGSEACDGVLLPKMADNGRDLCNFNKNRDNLVPFGQNGSSLYMARSGEKANAKSVCFRYEAPNGLATTVQQASGGISPETRMACNYLGSHHYCQCYLPSALGWKPWCSTNDPNSENQVHIGRLLSVKEMLRIIDLSPPSTNYKYFKPAYLDINYFDANRNKEITTSTAAYCTNNCSHPNEEGAYCMPGIVWLQNGDFLVWFRYRNSLGAFIYPEYPYVSKAFTDYSAPPVCVYELRNWYPHGGSGGCFGKNIIQTISVLADDILEITIGAGGQGGSIGSNGQVGGATIVKHKRAGVVLGTYTANGGDGGNKATTTNFGISTCDGAESGTDYTGGNGAGGALGGDADNTPKDGAANSFGGGGGGFCLRAARNASSCQNGAKGGSGKVDIAYNAVQPGGGGGAGASANEIEYKVTAGQRLVFSVGKGGEAGIASQIGKNGTATTFMENEIVFNPGSGGGFGVGGSAGLLKINTSKAKFNGTGLGSMGENGQLKVGTKYINYGFDGGSGGTTFLNYFGGCGGGMITDTNLDRACNSMPRDGANARTHNVVRNEYGGSGGGGGGVTSTNSTLGIGGDGADGYLRIRWGEE